MATLVIPTEPGTPFYTFRTRLEGREYTFEFTYSTREDRFYLAILDAENVRLVSGIKVIANWPLLRFYADERLPPGELVAMTLTADTSPPTLGELGIGRRVELTYFESAG